MWNVFLLLFCFTFFFKAINGNRLWGNKCIARCVLENAVAVCHVTWSNCRLFFILCYGGIWSPISISQDWDSFVILCKDPGPARREGGGRVPGMVLRHWANTPQTRNPFENLSVPAGFSESQVSCTAGCSGLQPSPVTGNPPSHPPNAEVKEGCLSVQFCTEGWQSRGKLCCGEDELLVLAAEDHLPVLDKEEEQQPWH